MAKRIESCATLGFPLNSIDVCYLVERYLDKRGLIMSRFKNNMPSKD